MVWCENVPAIVMITRLLEKSCPKCEAYFPTGKDESCKYGEISVTVQSIQIKGGYVIRKLDVQVMDDFSQMLQMLPIAKIVFTCECSVYSLCHTIPRRLARKNIFFSIVIV